MGALSDRIERRAAVGELAKRAGDEGLRKATDDRAAAIKEANAAAKKKYPDGVPPSVRKAIFKDPSGWLKSNQAGGDEVGEPASGKG